MATIPGKYITSDDVDNWPASVTDDDKRLTISQAEDLVERLTKDFFYPKEFSVNIDGNGTSRLFLDLIPDILSVTEVNVFGVELSAILYTTHDKNSVYLNPVTTTIPELTAHTLLVKHKLVLFPKGMGNIEVIGTYGWPVLQCPAAIKKAVIILCRADNDPTLYPITPDGLKSEKIDDYSYTKFDKPLVDSGISAVDRLLKPFIRKKPMVSII